MTYDDLRTMIADTLMRQDLSAAIPGWVTMAHTRINRELRHYRMSKRSTAVIGGRFTQLPSDYLQMTRLNIEDGPPLELVSQDRIRRLRDSGSGVPCVFAITGGEIEVYPAPADGTQVEMAYYATIPALSDSNQSNWLLDCAPEVYLYGSLIHSAPYLQDDERIQVWSALYRSAVDALNAENNMGQWAGKMVMR